MRFAHTHAHTLRRKLTTNVHSNGFGERFDEIETLLLHDLFHGFVDLRVIDGQTEVILQRCRTRIDSQVNIDFETLPEHLLFRIHTVAPIELHVAQTDKVTTHPRVLLLGSFYDISWWCNTSDRNSLRVA